jgi:hypothetical protein
MNRDERRDKESRLVCNGLSDRRACYTGASFLNGAIVAAMAIWLSVIGVVLIGGVGQAVAEGGQHSSAHGGDGAVHGAEGDEGEPIVLEIDPSKRRLPAITVKPGRYRVSYHLHVNGAHGVQLNFLEEKGGMKRIELLDHVSHDSKPEDISGEMSTIMMGRYELQYRLRGDDISGEVVLERIEEPATGVDGFGGFYLGEIQRVEQLSTRRIPPAIPRKMRIAMSVREDRGIVSVKAGDGNLERVSLKGPLLIGTRTKQGVQQEGMMGCQEHETVILQKKDRKSSRLRVLSLFACDDGTSVWQELSGTVMRE